MSRRFFPEVAVGFDVRSVGAACALRHRRLNPTPAVLTQDARVDLHICDGLKFVAVRALTAARSVRLHDWEHYPEQDAEPESYDVIIVDSSDPIGPASVLFTKVRLLSPV